MKYVVSTSCLLLLMVGLYLQIPSGEANCNSNSLLILNTFKNTRKVSDTILQTLLILLEVMNKCVRYYTDDLHWFISVIMLIMLWL